MLAPEEIIYLDNNATTQLDPAVLEEMRPFLEKYYGNPSSGYRFGAQVREAIERARARVARLLGCEASEITFTSGGTEANNAALHSALQLDARRNHVVTSAVEHSATLRFVEELVRRGGTSTQVGVDDSGRLNLRELREAVLPETAIVSVMWANNETGVLSPISDVAEIAREKRVLFHIDAIQAAGKIPIQLSGLGAHYASVSAHKLHGPKGVGALYVNPRSAFRPSLFGGGQENNRRSGTENVASIVGFGKAAELAAEKLPEEQTRVRALRDRFEKALRARIPDLSINGEGADRLPNTSSVAFPGFEAGAALLLLDQQRLCCSAGSACRTGSLAPSHVLRAMQVSDDRLRGSLRFSFGRFNTEAEMEKAVEIIARAMKKLRSL